MAELPGEPTAPDIVSEHAAQVRDAATELLTAFRYRGWIRTQLPREHGLLVDQREFRGQSYGALFDFPLAVHVLPDRSYQERFIQQCVARGDLPALLAMLAELEPERLSYAEDLTLEPEQPRWSQLEERRAWVWQAYAAWRAQRGVARAAEEWRNAKSGPRSLSNALDLEQRALREVCKELLGAGIQLKAVASTGVELRAIPGAKMSDVETDRPPVDSPPPSVSRRGRPRRTQDAQADYRRGVVRAVRDVWKLIPSTSLGAALEQAGYQALPEETVRDWLEDFPEDSPR